MGEVLQNDVVLGTVIKFLDFQSLKTVRLVNKPWNQLANPRLHERLALQHFDSDKRNIKKLYRQELQLKIPEIRVNIPVSIHLRKEKDEAQKIMKDLLSFERWRPRITCLQLNGFHALELNRHLPTLLSNLPSLKMLDLGSLNFLNLEKCILPENFVAPEIPQGTPLYLRALKVAYTADYKIPLDLDSLARCRYLEELYLDINTYPSCCKFVENLANLEVEGRFLPSCKRVHFVMRMMNLFRESKPILLKNAACIINRIEAKSLNLSGSTGLKLPTLLPLISYMPESITVDIPVSDDGICYTNWLMKTLKKFQSLRSLKELGLRPCVYAWGPGTEPVYIDKPYQHNFEGVKSLKVLFDKEEESYDGVLLEASSYLQNVSSLTLSNLRLANMYGLLDLQIVIDLDILEGIQGFPLLQKMQIEMEDDDRRILQTVERQAAIEERSGLLEPLCRVEGHQLRTLEIHLQLEYDMNMEAILFALFAGTEPRFGLTITVKQKAGRMFRKYTAEELLASVITA